MITDSDIVQLIRRHFLLELAKLAGIVVVLSVGIGWISGSWQTSFTPIGIAGFGVVYIALTKYPPVVKKHAELLEKYGDDYLSEAHKAISTKGIGRLINTRWFEVYAEDFCDRSIEKDA